MRRHIKYESSFYNKFVCCLQNFTKRIKRVIYKEPLHCFAVVSNGSKGHETHYIAVLGTLPASAKQVFEKGFMNFSSIRKEESRGARVHQKLAEDILEGHLKTRKHDIKTRSSYEPTEMRLGAH